MERGLLMWTRVCLSPRTRSFRVAADAMETKLPIYKNENKMFRTAKTNNSQTKTKLLHTAETITATSTGHKKTFALSSSVPLHYSTSSTAKSTDRRFPLLELLFPKFLLPKQRITNLSSLLLYYKQIFSSIFEKVGKYKVAKWLIDNSGNIGLYQCFIMLACTAFCGWQFWEGNWTEQSVKTTLEHYNFPLIRVVQFREEEKRFHDRVKVIGNISLNPVKLNALMDGYAVADALVMMQILFMFCTFPLVKLVKTPTILRHIMQMKKVILKFYR